MYQFEVCANSVQSCLAAQAGGAHRVELCAAIPEGGTTPSFGEISLARELLGIQLHVIIRPRGGDFLYSQLEISSMIKDIEMCKQLGVDGVVFGVLTADGNVDIPAMKELMTASKGLSVTFHRAFDVCNNPFQALEDIITLGCQRILTSGQSQTAKAGMGFLKELQQRTAGRIVLMAGSGVNETNIAEIAHCTGISEFHFSARELYTSEMRFRNVQISMGGQPDMDEFLKSVSSSSKVQKIISTLYETNSLK